MEVIKEQVDLLAKKICLIAGSSFQASDVSPRPGEERGRLLMYSFELHNEVIKDLIASRGALSGMVFFFITCCFTPQKIYTEEKRSLGD